VLDGVTNGKYKLLPFLTIFFLQSEEGTCFEPGKVRPSSNVFTADSLPFFGYRFITVIFSGTTIFNTIVMTTTFGLQLFDF